MLRNVPKYAKYIKDIVENKRRLNEFETVALTEECTSRIQHKLPQKLKDLGAPRPTKVMLQLVDRSYVYPEWEEKLLRGLREHKHAIGWIMFDIKDISPVFCM
ncbi:uncharacterized protein LOC142177438 [Nicotiana tabacum]|uniref:Uncharacterized protein LOC142177438 n=1 Tax=Nicotiana tabacum TaxID=4097 RepID=A0AC58TYG0_TOBAC